MTTGKNRGARFAFALLLGMLCLPAVAANPLRETVVCWEDGLKPPYLMLDPSSRPTGIAVDMVDEIFRHKSVKVKHVVRPWKRCLAEVESGEVDLVPNSSYREERARYALYSDPLYETHLVLFYTHRRFPDPPKITRIDDLKAFRLGGILGFNYDQYEGVLPIDTSARNRRTLVRMLEVDRYDFVIEQLEIIRMMEARGEIRLNGIGHTPDPVTPTKKFHVLVSKRHPDARQLKKILDEGIAGLQRDGTSRRISARYLSPGDLPQQ